MDLKELLTSRKSTRAYLDKAVDPQLIEEILDAARHAPSGTNTQPWQVAVVSGETRDKLTQALEKAFRDGEKSQIEYQYYPLEWKEPFKGRRRECGLQMYNTLDIKREDKQRQIDQWAANFRGFDAPVILFFFMDSVMETGSYLDYGMFMQSVMLAAQDAGLATCPQAALAEYPTIVREHLGYNEDSILIAGMALGYEDTDALVNSYRTSREEVASFTRFFS
ncbi:MAG: nitroreductase [Gammaproteobacteria bacterium]|nr:nitroreductase [Gammaproteobacteria bacterium]